MDPGSRRTKLIAVAALAIVLLDRAVYLFAPRPTPVSLWWGWPVPLSYFVLLALIAVAVLLPDLRRIRWGVAGVVVLETLLLVVQTQLAPTPPSFPHHRDRFHGLVSHIHALARPDDRLFVWGWAPEIYSLARLEPASIFTIASYIVRDEENAPTEPRLDSPLAERLMDELRRDEPRFIVDAAERSWTMVASGDPWLYDIDLYPELGLRQFLGQRYRRLGRYNGCDLYVSNEPMSRDPDLDTGD